MRPGEDFEDRAEQPLEEAIRWRLRLIESSAKLPDAVRVIFESDGPIEMLAHRRSQLTAGRAEVEQRSSARRKPPDQPDQNAMAASLEVLECVDVRHDRGRVVDGVGEHNRDQRFAIND